MTAPYPDSRTISFHGAPSVCVRATRLAAVKGQYLSQTSLRRRRRANGTAGDVMERHVVAGPIVVEGPGADRIRRGVVATVHPDARLNGGPERIIAPRHVATVPLVSTAFATVDALVLRAPACFRSSKSHRPSIPGVGSVQAELARRRRNPHKDDTNPASTDPQPATGAVLLLGDPLFVQDIPHLVGGDRDVEVRHPEMREGVHHGVRDRGGCAHGRGLADPLGAEGVVG